MPIDLSRAWNELQSINRERLATPAEQHGADMRARREAIAAGVAESELPVWRYYGVYTPTGIDNYHRVLVDALLKYGNPPTKPRVPVWTPKTRTEHSMKFRDCFGQRDAERYAHDLEFCGAIFAFVGINLNDDNTCTINFQLPKGKLEAFKQKFRTTYAHDFLAEPFRQRARVRRPSTGGKRRHAGTSVAAAEKALRKALRK